nr:hypothetical protein [Candidatus Sigynarchaeota archaeon]
KKTKNHVYLAPGDLDLCCRSGCHDKQYIDFEIIMVVDNTRNEIQVPISVFLIIQGKELKEIKIIDRP